MELEKIAVRALFAYLFLLGLMRCSGKRTVSQTSLFNFVFALIMGDMIDDALWAEVPMSMFVVGCGTLVIAELLVSLGSNASTRFAELVEGRPTIFMRNGTPCERGMREEQMNQHEIAEMLRQEGLDTNNWREVKIGRIEVSGDPSVLKHDDARTVRKEDLKRLWRVLP